MPSSIHALATSLAEVSDQDAIDEVKRGNREMFEVLVRRYNQQLFRVGIAYLRDHAQAEDAMQNAYLKAFVNLAYFQKRASFSTWITRIMVNECLMALRRRRQDAGPPAGEENEFTATETTAPQGAAQLNLKEMKSLLENAIGELPRNYRSVYVLREIQQMTVAETAASLGISAVSVKVTLHRARERLKTELLKSAAGLELFSFRAQFCDPMTARVMAAVLAVA